MVTLTHKDTHGEQVMIDIPLCSTHATETCAAITPFSRPAVFGDSLTEAVDFERWLHGEAEGRPSPL